MTTHTLPPEVKLAPCPFCGGPVNLTQSKTLGDRLFVIECEASSPCFGSGLGTYVVAHQKDEAIAAWNRRAEPSRARAAPEVKVLSWERVNSTNEQWAAASIVGDYRVVERGTTFTLTRRSGDYSMGLGRHDTIDEAKAAAQADYNARIRSTLE